MEHSQETTEGTYIVDYRLIWLVRIILNRKDWYTKSVQGSGRWMGGVGGTLKIFGWGVYKYL